MKYKVSTKLLTPNKWSRPQNPLQKVKGIVVHWIASPMGKPEGVWNFWENRKYGENGYGSAHEVIGLDGNILISLPHNEMAYAVGSKTYTEKAIKKLGNYPNLTTYNIECCHLDWDGRMTKDTIQSLRERLAYWCKYFNLNPLEDIWLHKTVVGWKDCHRWYVNNPSEFDQLKKDVYAMLYPQPKREEVIKLISKYFKDIPADHWSISSADSCYEKGIVKGNGQGELNFGKPVTKEEMVVMLDRVIDYVLKEMNK